LDDEGTLLSLGGKNTEIDGWNPMNLSSDWGATWGSPKKSKFPALGTNQRPSLFRLANGHLVFATDSYNRRNGESPDGWECGKGCVVGISKDNGETWHIKRLPVELPHERDQKNGTLGYVTVRQAPNGVIHVLATMTHPCLHYEFNEAWIFSDAGDASGPAQGGRTERFEEEYPNGKPRVKWSARITSSGRYLLHGKETSYYENGRKEHEVEYSFGRKTGTETFWSPEGVKLWSWRHQPRRNRGTWTHYWDNGKKRIESHWNTQPAARDLDRDFIGLEAEGETRHWSRDGKLSATYEFVKGELVSSSENGEETHGAD